ncbi:hypothetical protein QFC22_004854 [Naganishia vaughanmartiniae]|uniref:Uncharacterized protein n=1 Tax=Naganishia vaughanmartiniae TaxID=1424756 RepID=A0ACC2WZF1_9TREE|nr:hypothetical protein QFC22_004854 [Naganishia vaughanmartiniae]
MSAAEGSCIKCKYRPPSSQFGLQTRTTKPCSSFVAIDSDSVHRIHSGQVVLGLDGALKELVENSIDAGATVIGEFSLARPVGPETDMQYVPEVKIKDNGLDAIEVVDNGAGINEADWQSAALKHHTSKISSFADLSNVDTFGFRGEALSALCALSQSVTICTSTQETQPLGRILKFGRDGTLVDSNGKIARQRGTTVTVEKLFSPLPVRRKEFERNAKRDFAKALGLLTAYALVPSCHPRIDDQQQGSAAVSRGIRLTVDSINKTGKKTNHLRSDGKGSLRSAVSAVWGVAALESLIDVDISLEVEIDKAMAKREGLEVKSQTVRVTGLISASLFGSGRASSDRQYYYINGRPFVATKIARAVNELYKSYNTNQFPFVVLDLQIPSDAVDVNVSPDKREIFVHSENNLIEALKNGLEQIYEPSRSTYLEQNIPTPPRHSIAAKGTKPQPLFLADDENEEPGRNVTAGQSVESIANTSSHSQRNAQNPSTNAPPTRSRNRSPSSTAAASHSLAPRPSTLNELDRPIGILQGHPRRSLPATYFSPTPKATLEYDEGEDDNEGFSQDEEVRLILDDSRSAPSATFNQPVRRLLQTTLNCVITRGNAVDSSMPSDAPLPNNVSARAKLRGQIAGFASQGAVIELDELDSDSDSDRVVENGIRHVDKEPVATSHSVLRDDADEALIGDGTEVQSTSSTPDESHQTPLSSKPIDPEDIVMGTQDSTLVDDTAAHIINNNQYILREQDEDISYLADVEPGHAESSNAGTFRSEILKASLQGEITIRCDIDRIRARARKRRIFSEAEAVKKKRKLDESDMLPDAGITNADTAQVDRVLSRVIGKENFNEMVILGQFNLAFIIARRSKPAGEGRSIDDIFIIDQHASDEKYNFETLQATTRIRSQTLIQPKPLQLSPADEITAMENLDILAKNGFGVSVDEDAPYGKGERIRLTSMPVSQETVFDVKDLEELIFLLQDQYIGSMVRSKKARAMFAMRACRKSVMFGKALSRSQMQQVGLLFSDRVEILTIGLQIVRHMGTIDQPWNCPHGRPTMRHLMNLATWNDDDTKDTSKKIDWSSVDLSDE